MFVVHVHVHVKPESIDAFKQASLTNARESVKEPGVARFDVVQQQDDPSRFVLVEVYRSLEANAAHKETKRPRDVQISGDCYTCSHTDGRLSSFAAPPRRPSISSELTIPLRESANGKRSSIASRARQESGSQFSRRRRARQKGRQKGRQRGENQGASIAKRQSSGGRSRIRASAPEGSWPFLSGPS